MIKSVLVTGGAGYVGSAVSEALIEAGHKVVILDNLATGFTSLIPTGCVFFMGSYGDYDGVKKIIAQENITSIIHCAAKSLVQESVEDPLAYHQSNVSESIQLLRAAVDSGVKEFIFSSSAAVYGQPEISPITEQSQLSPINPYGDTKVAFERTLSAAAKAYGIKTVAFRYFNVAGATEFSKERHAGETHLIPRMISSAMSGMRFKVFGDDYETDDGSAVRDYIHVADIAYAHVLCLDYFDRREYQEFAAINIGSGIGTSVFQAANSIGRKLGNEVKLIVDARRPGDPASLVADISMARSILGWEPSKSNIDQIVESVIG